MSASPSAHNLVAIETATETVGVAVVTRDGVSAELTLTGRRRHVEALTPALDHLLTQVDLRPTDLHAVAVDVGPGLFTGLRVGVAAAKGLAQAVGIGILGATSLEILLEAARCAGTSGWVVGVIDARRSEVFTSLASVDPAGTVSEHSSPQLMAPPMLASMLRELGGVSITAVGDGAQRYAELLEEVPGVRVLRAALAFPPPSTLLTLAARRLEQGEAPASPGTVVPVYMREADAKVNFTQAIRG